MTAATIIRTYHEDDTVGKRFESSQFPHRPIGTKVGGCGLSGFTRKLAKTDISESL
jgi:hypothetical protein